MQIRRIWKVSNSLMSITSVMVLIYLYKSKTAVIEHPGNPKKFSNFISLHIPLSRFPFSLTRGDQSEVENSVGSHSSIIGPKPNQSYDMERLGDDELALILKWIQKREDRNSFSLVCKRWCKIKRLNRSSLCVFVPAFLPHFLPRFPNLVKFVSSEMISNYQINLLANTCPRIQLLNLNCKVQKETSGEVLGINDFDDDGISAIAIACCNLRKVFLSRRIGIGSKGVVSLASFSRNLVHLDLSFCTRITDEALEAIGTRSSLRVLYLQGCNLITDAGLAFLSQGHLPHSLEDLNLARCDLITDKGLMSLREMHSLQVLHLANCGPRVTDTGGKAITAMKSLKRLFLSGLVNVSDITIIAIAEHCKNLEALDLSGCKLVTRLGMHALAHLNSLWYLKLDGIAEFRLKDLEQLVFGCQSLRCIRLDKKWKTLIPVAAHVNFLRRNRMIFVM